MKKAIIRTAAMLHVFTVAQVRQPLRPYCLGR